MFTMIAMLAVFQIYHDNIPKECVYIWSLFLSFFNCIYLSLNNTRLRPSIYIYHGVVGVSRGMLGLLYPSSQQHSTQPPRSWLAVPSNFSVHNKISAGIMQVATWWFLVGICLQLEPRVDREKGGHGTAPVPMFS